MSADHQHRLTPYQAHVLSLMPVLMHVPSDDVAAMMLATVATDDTHERAYLVSSLIVAQAQFLRASVDEELAREWAARPWWRRAFRRRPLPTYDALPVIDTGGEDRPGSVAAVQAIAAWVSGRTEDAASLMRPWIEGERDEESWADLLGQLLVQARTAHALLHCSDRSQS